MFYSKISQFFYAEIFQNLRVFAKVRLSFHPNDNTGTIIISQEDFIKFLEAMGNSYEFVELYD